MGAIIHTGPAAFFVSVDGLNVSNLFNPFLERITVVDYEGTHLDTCEIVLEDEYGILAMPPINAFIEVGLGWQDTGPFKVFSGALDVPTSEGSRHSGRHLILRSISMKPNTQLKTTQNVHRDAMPFIQAAQDFASIDSITKVVADPSVANLQRQYWKMSNESFLNWGQSMARTLGLNFKMAMPAADQQIASFSAIDASTSASGLTMATIAAVVGENVIRWELHPYYQLATFGKYSTAWYDSLKAAWNYAAPGTSGGDVGGLAALVHRFKAPDATQGQEQAKSNEGMNNMMSVGGTLVIDGEPEAMGGCTLSLSGARSQIDGIYRIDIATHVFTRAGGYTTELHLKAPSAAGNEEGDGS